VGVRGLQQLAPYVQESLRHWGHQGQKKGDKPGRCTSHGKEMQIAQTQSRSRTPNHWVCQ